MLDPLWYFATWYFVCEHSFEELMKCLSLGGVYRSTSMFLPIFDTRVEVWDEVESTESGARKS